MVHAWPAGHFLELVRRHDSPMFEPRFDYGASAPQHQRADSGRKAGLAQRQEHAVLLPGSHTGRKKLPMHVVRRPAR